MASLDDLTEAIAAQPRVEDAVEMLLDDLAARIKATSNDQNIQRLARDLKREAPALARAVAGKTHAGKTHAGKTHAGRPDGGLVRSPMDAARTRA